MPDCGVCGLPWTLEAEEDVALATVFRLLASLGHHHV
jgi:hypothetical protein